MQVRRPLISRNSDAPHLFSRKCHASRPERLLYTVNTSTTFNNLNIMTCSKSFKSAHVSTKGNGLSHPRPCHPKQSDRVACATTIRWHYDHHAENSQKERARNVHFSNVCECLPCCLDIDNIISLHLPSPPRALRRPEPN